MEVAPHEKKLLGILGGMGPEAGLEFARILVEKTPARRDQDHIPFILLNYPRIPDRTDFIMGRGPDPVPLIVEGVGILQRAGATHIVIPCNTAHVFLERIKKASEVKIYDMIGAAAEFVKREYPSVKRLGLLATKGTLISGIYEKYFDGYELMAPEGEEQEKVHLAIYQGAKRSGMEDAVKPLIEVAENLIEQGAEGIILGCTEVEAALGRKALPVPSIKPMEALVEKILSSFFKK